jgi:uncharacterized protein (DUF1684 family)
MSEYLELLDYRRTVADLYRKVRNSEPSRTTWEMWRKERDGVFASHPQSPIEDKSQFTSLPFFDYDPVWRLEGEFHPEDATAKDISNSGADSTPFERIGRVDFEIDGQPYDLSVLWLRAYGGGMFIPFRDRTNGDLTYGGGRYLIDSLKGADLGQTSNGLILDFNYAYHPSCVHSPRWSCPLAPPENSLDVEVNAGEQIIRST